VRQLLNYPSGLADAGVPDLHLPRPATLEERIVTLQNAHPSSWRAYGYLTLIRAMPGTMTWLGLCEVLGALNGLTRGLWLARQS
jgi:hypothetical protein